jgi:hypothetical protein
MLGPRKEPFYNRIAWVFYVEILLKVALSTINKSINQILIAVEIFHNIIGK